jgi:signal transduction histidine kinase
VSAPSTFFRRIRTRLVVTYCLITAALFALIGGLFYFIARDALDEEMGRRLVTLAVLAAERQNAEQLLSLLPGDEDSATYRRSLDLISGLMTKGAASRMYMIDASNRSLVDSQPGVAVGTEYYRLETHRAQIRRAFNGETVHAPVFLGLDGRWYKAAFAPVGDARPAHAVLVVEAGASFFGTLKSIKRNLLVFGIAATALIVGVSVFLEAGDLETRIEATTRDEIGMLASSLDAARRAVVERDRFLQMLQRGIAHEVRNPLGGMRLFCDILADELADRPDQASHVDKIRREIGGLENVVNEFLAFTRDVSLSPQRQTLGAFLRELLAGYMNLADRNIRLDLSVDPPDLEAVFDAERLRRAMFNLVNNAVQAMPEGGILTVRAERDRAMFELVVGDTGVGIEDQNLEQLFTPFFTTKDKGTGLGMPFAKKIVESHGGTIRVDSRLGKGTTVTIRLPIAAGKEEHGEDSRH